MTFSEFQIRALLTRTKAAYDAGLAYSALGLAGEAGEFCDQVKRVARDDRGELTEERAAKLKLELGDVLWYAADAADKLGVSLDDIAEGVLQKLRDRQQRGKLHGEGDKR